MAQKRTAFITGANAKVKVGGKTFAYASDVSYQVTVDTIPVETMGRYEPVTNEPVSYSVAGELSVVRYTVVAKGMNGVADTGNGLGHVLTEGGGAASDQINPDSMLFSTTWDLTVFQKIHPSDPQQDGAAKPIITIHDCRFTRKSAALNKRGLLVDRLAFVGVLADDESFAAVPSGDTDLSV